LADPDPLFSLRANQRNQCVGRAGGDCLSVRAGSQGRLWGGCEHVHSTCGCV
jgi:hypothetical protein